MMSLKSLRKILPVLALAPCLLCVASVWAENRGGEEDVLRATLENGLRVVIVRNTLAPVVTTIVNYMVGRTRPPRGFPEWPTPRST